MQCRLTHCCVVICSFVFCLSSPRVSGDDAGPNIHPKAGAGRKATGSAERTAPNIRVNADLVLVPVTVMDYWGQLITGLERQHFRLFEDKVEQPITQFAYEDAPVSVVLLLDRSGSMAPKSERARQAVVEFLETANPDDEFSLIEFSDSARLRKRFTNDPDEIQSLLMSTVSKGSTALLDAICLALNVARSGAHKRKAILIISDGGDNCSRYTKREVRDRVRESDVQIHSVAIQRIERGSRMVLEEMNGPFLLEEIAKDSGGLSFQANEFEDLVYVANRIGTALRNQYVLGYSPQLSKSDGKYHRIDVKVVGPANSSGVRTTFRSGYIAPEP